MNGHPLKAELGRLKSGVDAFDLIKTTLDPVQYNEVSSSQEALDRFMNLKLHSISKGSFEKFKIQLEERIEDMAANNMALATDENTLKLSLFNKLPHESYKHGFLNMNQFEGMNYKATLRRLQENAALIESAEAKSNKQRNRQVNNTNSSESTKATGKPIPGTIGGHKVDKQGKISGEAWKKMSNDEKKAFFDAVPLGLKVLLLLLVCLLSSIHCRHLLCFSS